MNERIAYEFPTRRIACACEAALHDEGITAIIATTVTGPTAGITVVAEVDSQAATNTVHAIARDFCGTVRPSIPLLRGGIYMLGTDITNPHPDRRYKDDWLAANVWKAGWRFGLRRAAWIERTAKRILGDEATEQAFELRCLSKRGAHVTVYQRPGAPPTCISLNDNLTSTLPILVANLKPSTDKLDELRWLFYERGDEPDDSAWNVLAHLFGKGDVSISDVRGAQVDLDAEAEAEETADSPAATPGNGAG